MRLGLSRSLTNKQAKHTQFNNFTERISFAEHGKLVAESSERVPLYAEQSA